MLSEVIKNIIRVKNVVAKINISYENYEKLYLGYCLGGFMVNNYISGKNIVGYTYNPFGCKINNEYDLNITNYCQELDMANILYRINKQQIISLNSFTDIFDSIDINTIGKKILVPHYLHNIKDDDIIEIYF
jgi:hypothetical protein